MIESEGNIKVVIAFHKPCHLPDDVLYLPLFVGADAGSHLNEKGMDSNIAKDNTGDNISALNPYFCELTGLYWAWKNLSYDYVGLVQYRRYFTLRKRIAGDRFANLLTYEEIQPFLGKIRVFVPKKRRYYIESLYSHYKHTHYKEHLDKAREIIQEKYPAYSDSCNRVYNRSCGYMFNIMIMEQRLLDEYCTWLFDILFTLKERVDLNKLSEFQSRLFGRVGEILFNVWLDYQINIGSICKNEIKELPWMFMGKVNWWKKGTSFLLAKMFGKKYDENS